MITKAMAAGLAASLLLAGPQAAFAQVPANPQTGAVKVSAVDAKFMVSAAQSDMTEIKTSQLALDKSQNEAVRKYAEEMIAEHTKSSSELKPLADRKSVTLPANLNPKQQALYNKLSGLSGEAFDKAYLQGQTVAHADTAALFKNYLRTGKDAEAKQFARKVMPVVQGHLADARELSAGRVARSPGGAMGNMNQSSGMGNMNQPSGAGNMNQPGSTGSDNSMNRPGGSMQPSDSSTSPTNNPSMTNSTGRTDIPGSSQTGNTKDSPYPKDQMPKTQPK